MPKSCSFLASMATLTASNYTGGAGGLGRWVAEWVGCWVAGDLGSWVAGLLGCYVGGAAWWLRCQVRELLRRDGIWVALRPERDTAASLARCVAARRRLVRRITSTVANVSGERTLRARCADAPRGLLSPG